jgi:hypothetical protein
MTEEQITTEILPEMFRYVGLSDTPEFIATFTKRKNWQLKKSWTLSNQNAYRAWLINYLIRHKEPRVEAKMWAENWLTQNGWRQE